MHVDDLDCSKAHIIISTTYINTVSMVYSVPDIHASLTESLAQWAFCVKISKPSELSAFPKVDRDFKVRNKDPLPVKRSWHSRISEMIGALAINKLCFS